MAKYVENLDTVWQMNLHWDQNQLIGKIIRTTDTAREGWFECYMVVDLSLMNHDPGTKRWYYTLVNLRNRLAESMEAQVLMDAIRGRKADIKNLEATGNLKFKVIPEHEYMNKVRTLYWMAELQSE